MILTTIRSYDLHSNTLFMIRSYNLINLRLLKDMVNKKLIQQEKEKFLKISKNITDKNELSILRKKIFYTNIFSPRIIIETII